MNLGITCLSTEWPNSDDLFLDSHESSGESSDEFQLPYFFDDNDFLDQSDHQDIESIKHPPPSTAVVHAVGPNQAVLQPPYNPAPPDPILLPNQNNPQKSCNFMCFQPCSTWFVNNTSQKRNTSRPCHRAPKRRVDLSADAKEFKEKFYAIFTKRKKFEKKFVKDIHDCFLIEKLNICKMNREETRRIDIYFQNYADRKEEILKVLRENKNEISQKFLKNILENY